MKIAIDQSLCQATGMCTGIAPDLFALDEDGTLHLLDPDPGQQARPAAGQAVRNCPTGAITLTD